MSRAYRIKVNESVKRVIRAEDHVSSQLEILEILPPDEMADLLAAELVKRGFEREGDAVVRRQWDVTVSVDLASGAVTVRAESADEVELKGERRGVAYDDWGPDRQQAEEALRESLKKGLERDAEKRAGQLQQQVTDQLEAELADLRSALDQAVNRATAEALKQKAARIGQIKEMTDDPQSGSLTIVVEV